MPAHPPRRAAKPADWKACGPRGEPSARAGSAAADPSRQRRSELTARLVHDVGKYLARTARNLPAGCALDAALLDMLCRDLYGDARSPRPSARFAELAAGMGAPGVRVDKPEDLAGALAAAFAAGGPRIVEIAIEGKR